MAARQRVDVEKGEDFVTLEEFEARDLLLNDLTKDAVGRHCVVVVCSLNVCEIVGKWDGSELNVRVLNHKDTPHKY